MWNELFTYLYEVSFETIREMGIGFIARHKMKRNLKSLINRKFTQTNETNIVFESLSDYIKDDLVRYVRKLLQEPNKSKRESAEKVIIDLAIKYSKAEYSESRKLNVAFVTSFIQDCITVVHDSYISSIKAKDRLLLAEALVVNVDNVSRMMDSREEERKLAIREKMSAQLSRAWDLEIKKNPSMKRLNFNEKILPYGRTEILEFSTQSIDKDFDKKETTLDEIIKLTREKNTYNSIFMYGIGGLGKTVALLRLSACANKVYVPLRFVHDSIYDYIFRITFLSDQTLYNEFLSFCRENDNPPIIILDGLNEMEFEERCKIKAEIKNVWAAYGVQLIISSRYDAAEELSVPQMIRLSCNELSEKTILKFLSDFGVNPPDKASHLWEIINTPLMLTLFTSTELNKKPTHNFYSDSINAGAIIWNYIISEIDRIEQSRAASVGMVAVVFQYIAPYLAYNMIINGQNLFSIPMKTYASLVEVACQSFELDRNNNQLDEKLERLLQKCQFKMNKTEIYDILTNQICLCVDLGTSIQFVHQHFRDSLAALYVYQLSTNSHEEVLYHFLLNNRDQYVFDYLVDYYQFLDVSKEHACWTKQWEKYKREPKLEGSCVEKMLEIYRRAYGNDISSVDFSGMDISCISLRGFDLSKSKHNFVNTTIGRQTFSGDGHTMMVSSLSWTSNSSNFYSSSHDMTIRVWNHKKNSDQILNGMDEVEHYIRSVKVCPYNDSLLAYGGDDRRLVLYEVGKGLKGNRTISESADFLYSIEWGADGKSIVYGDRSGNLKQVFIDSLLECHYYRHKSSIRHIDCSSDNLIVSGDDSGLVCVWEPGVKRPRICMDFGHKVIAVHWLCKKNYLAVVSNNHLYLIDCGRIKGEICCHSGVECSDITNIKIKKGVCAAAFRSYEDAQYCAFFTNNAAFVFQIVQNDFENKVIEIASRRIDDSELGVVSCAEWDYKCQSLVFGSRNGSIWMGKLSIQEEVFERLEIERISSGNLNSARCSAWNNAGTLLASGYDDGRIRVRSTESYNCVKVLTGHQDSVKCLSWHPNRNDQLVSGSDDGSVRLWDLTNGERVLFHKESPVNGLLWLDSGIILAATDSGEIHAINLDTGTVSSQKGSHTSRVYSLTDSLYAKRFISAGDDKTLCMWEVDENGSCLCIQSLDSNHKKPIRSIVFCKNIKHTGVYSAGNDGKILFRAINGVDGLLSDSVEELPRFHNDFIYSITKTESNEYIITGGTDASIGIWDAVTHSWFSALQGHDSFIWHVSSSPQIDNKYYVASSSSDGSVRIWDISNMNKLNPGHSIEGIPCLGVYAVPIILPAFTNTNVVECDFTGASFSDSGLELLIKREGGIVD